MRRRKEPRQDGNCILTIRMRPREARRLYREAARADVSVNSYVNNAVLAMMEREHA